MLTSHCRLHRRQSPGLRARPHLAFELRPLRMSSDGELLKPDGELSEDEDIALTRTIAALVLNLRGIDPDLRESGLDMLCGLAARKWVLSASPVQMTPHSRAGIMRSILQVVCSSVERWTALQSERTLASPVLGNSS